MIPVVVASETGQAQTLIYQGVAGPRCETKEFSGITLESLATEGDSPVHEKFNGSSGIPSTTEHEEFRWNPGGPSPKAKYFAVTDSELVP